MHIRSPKSGVNTWGNSGGPQLLVGLYVLRDIATRQSDRMSGTELFCLTLGDDR